MVDNKITRAVVLLVFRMMTTRLACQVFHHPSNVIFVGSRICIKPSHFTTLAEAEAMKFISTKITVPVPKIYLAFEHKGKVYIVMQRIKGRSLPAGWIQRSAQSKERIFKQLRQMVQEIRNIPSPENSCVSNLLGGPICDQRLPGQAHWGPFKSIRDFHRKLRADIELENVKEPGDVSRELKDLIRFHEGPWSKPVLTHGDLELTSISMLA
ncbi:hypothetical protein BB8028_0005g00070 [Beauveria bassiana]|uniref:Aminoglycoside phosphotransferase domain-containing protein n=1 Tax=Beauveria bassiana TaxID=176275 RepID=A0A2S7YE88_BEABA|nr:hypothetical protein BB8028_0005g00070 [Beauveria bassiana]